MKIDEFISALDSLGLVPSADVHRRIQATKDVPTDARELAKLLVGARVLTVFQAQHLLAGNGQLLIWGDYVVIDKLGAGGMGEVHRARHRRMNRLVAIKRMSAQRVKSPEAVKRFQREVEAAARLSHPNIIAALDAREERGVHLLVMEWCDGADLATVVKDKGPLSVTDAIDCVLQAARGLEYAHAQGVIHRDIKPANLLLDKQGIVKILDMGLARFDESADRTALTGTEDVMGTIDYMSPEQALRTHDADARSDIYSLGCTLWFLLTGQRLYEGDSVTERLLAHRDAAVPSLMAVRENVPWALEQLFRRMVAKRPRDRQGTMSAVIVELEAVKMALSPEPAPGKIGAVVDPQLGAFLQSATPTEAWLGADPHLAPSPGSRAPSSSPARRQRIKPIRASRRPLMIGLSVLAIAGLVTTAWLTLRTSNISSHAAQETTVASSVTPPARPTTPVRQTPSLATAPFDKKMARAHQEAWAKYLDRPVEATDKIGMKLTLIPPGEFQMGSSPEEIAEALHLANERDDLLQIDLDNYRSEAPSHKVRITYPFYCGTREVSVAEFRKFIEASEYPTDAERHGAGDTANPDEKAPEKLGLSWRKPGYALSEDQPVTQVTWGDAIMFCNWLSEQEGLPPAYESLVGGAWVVKDGNGYRLPTEAEWEYACRAGTITSYNFGIDDASMYANMWFMHTASGKPEAVGTKPPNAFGLFDMHGNVYEWCQDPYDSVYYAESPVEDPRGPISSTDRVKRSGAWNSFSGFCRTAYRTHDAPSGRLGNSGFRVVRKL